MAAAVEGAQVDVDTAFAIESRYFAELATGQVAKNMIQAFFFDLQHDQLRRRPRPTGFPQHTAKKVGVLGAGHDGRGHRLRAAPRPASTSCSRTSSLEAAEKGKALLREAGRRRRVAKGKITAGEGRGAAGAHHPDRRRRPTLAGCDLVIEAVFENVELKHKVFQEIRGRGRAGRAAGLQHLHAADHAARARA